MVGGHDIAENPRPPLRASANRNAIAPGLTHHRDRIRGLENVTITEDEADAWLSGINDLRLYLSAIDADDPVRREERDNLVDWLAYNQGTLLDAMGHDIDMQ